MVRVTTDMIFVHVKQTCVKFDPKWKALKQEVILTPNTENEFIRSASSQRHSDSTGLLDSLSGIRNGGMLPLLGSGGEGRQLRSCFIDQILQRRIVTVELDDSPPNPICLFAFLQHHPMCAV